MALHRPLGHACGAVGVAGLLLLAGGLAVPVADPFPDSRAAGLHALLFGMLRGPDGLPPEHEPDWRERVEPGDVIFLSRGRVPWGRWSHAAVVVQGPAGSLVLVDASIHDGVSLVPIETYAGWPRVAVRRASHDVEVRARIAARALTHLGRIFTAVLGAGAPYTNCTAVAVDALRAAGLDPALTGWGTPDELLRSAVWPR